MMRSSIARFAIALSLAGSALGAQQQDCPAMHAGDLPLKYKGGATVPAITPCDLMTRLYIFSDDSILGRRVGTPDNIRATAYIEREVRRLGLVLRWGQWRLLPVSAGGFELADMRTARPRLPLVDRSFMGFSGFQHRM